MSIRVLFLSRSNAARSQIAEYLLNAMGRGRFEAVSAGNAPQPIDPLAIRILDEARIDARGALSKPLESLGDARFDYIINICDESSASCPGARTDCPSLPGRTSNGCWGFGQRPSCEAGEEEALAYLRRVRDQTLNRLRIWMAAVDKPAAHGAA